MSLLMDALRRAEAEKEQAAKQNAAEKLAREKKAQSSTDNQQSRSEGPAEEDEDLGATIKLDRLPLPMSQNSTDGLAPNSTNIDIPVGGSLDDLSVDFESTSPRLRGEQSHYPQTTNSESGKEPSQDNRKAKTEEPFDFSIHANSENGVLSLQPLQENTIANPDPLPEPIASKTSTLPSARKPPFSPDNDPTLAEGNVDPLMISTPGEATLETSSGQTAASANTVFEAGAPGISRRMILWTLGLGVALFALLAVSGIYYFQQAPTARPMPSPIASVELEKARLALEIETQKASIAGPSVAEVKPTDRMPTNVLKTEKINPADPKILQVEESAADLSKVEGNQSAPLTVASQSAASTSVMAGETSSSQSSVKTTFTGDERVPVLSERKMASRGAPNVDTRRLKVAKSMRGARSNEQVIAAYKAYQSGDLNSAKLLYEKALSIRPQDINALNGLAALALGDGMKEKAHRLYSRALKLAPNNPTAAAALFQIEGGAGTRVTESQLKLMLDNGGDLGLINFALGNLYSGHGRWNDAQLAFFEAVRHQPDNADYLFNLAVSLDHIGQRKPALDYYQQALTVSDNSIAGFSTADVIARILTIKQRASSSAP